MIRGFQKNVFGPVGALLSQGMPAERIAWSMAIGLCISAIPVLGVTSLLCLAAAVVFRLNIAAMQAVNWLATPLQLALFLPFHRTGAWFMNIVPLPINPVTALDQFRADPWGFAGAAWQQTLAGTLLWFIASILFVWVFFQFFRLVVRSIAGRIPGPITSTLPGQS